MPLKDELHKFVDSHIREIQYSVYAVGALGLFFVVRDLRLATTFRHVSEIPPKFITSHVTLQGRVQEVSGSGLLNVRHQPVFSLPFSGWLHRLRSGAHDTGTLTVELAGVEMTTAATQWLTQHTANQHVWFTLLQPSPQSVLCCVYKKKNVFLKLNLNEAIIKEGLAPVHIDHHLLRDKSSRTQEGLFSRLLAAQRLAQKRQKGMWKDTSEDDPGHKGSLWKRLIFWVKMRLKGRKRDSDL